jgi:hypothetical protein
MLVTDDKTNDSLTTMIKDMVSTFRAALSLTGAGDGNLRHSAIQFLKSHLTRFDFDARYVRDITRRNTMSKMYFGFVTCILSDFGKILESIAQSGNDLVDLLLCFFFIVHNGENVSQWFNTQESINKLCNLLTVTLIIVRVCTDLQHF